MLRIQAAIERHKPPHVRIVNRREQADLVVLYTIGIDAIEVGARLLAEGRRYAVVQCCVAPSICPLSWWEPFWENAQVVWSYYDLASMVDFPFNFYHAPLGIDDVFKQPVDLSALREPLALTTGYVHGYGAEAIEEMWQAARVCGLRSIHIGPRDVVGTNEHADEHVQPDDEGLADLYRRAKYVGGMRYVEGFELPAVEALSCGARPFVFGQPSMRYWLTPDVYRAAYFVEETSGEQLVTLLSDMMSQPFYAVEARTLRWLHSRFNWKTIAEGFWQRINELAR